MQAVTELFGVFTGNLQGGGEFYRQFGGTASLGSSGGGKGRLLGWSVTPDLIFSFCRSPAILSRRRRVAQWEPFSGLVSTLWWDGVPNGGAVTWRWKMLLTSGSRSTARRRGLIPPDLSTVGMISVAGTWWCSTSQHWRWLSGIYSGRAHGIGSPDCCSSYVACRRARLYQYGRVSVFQAVWSEAFEHDNDDHG